MCAFMLQTLSSNKEYSAKLNKTFSTHSSLPSSIRLYAFNGTYADFLIIVKYLYFYMRVMANFFFVIVHFFVNCLNSGQTFFIVPCIDFNYFQHFALLDKYWCNNSIQVINLVSFHIITLFLDGR
jgi:hypothetical protein